jgi:putative oxidoreductase
MQYAPVMVAARVAMALLFVITGAQKVGFPSRMAPLFKSMGLPAQVGILIGLFEVGSGLAFAVGFELRWVAWALAVWCLVTAAMGHRFWQDPNPMQLSNFLKNIGLAGAFMAFGALAEATLVN